jgi:hypothetical protein
MLSVLRLYKEDQLPLQRSLETAVRRVGGWCEMAASLRGREPGTEECPLVKTADREDSACYNELLCELAIAL